MRYRHKKRGGIYEVITPGAKLQCSTNREIERFFEEAAFTIYRSVENGATYIRPTAEFFDGRFEAFEPQIKQQPMPRCQGYADCGRYPCPECIRD